MPENLKEKLLSGEKKVIIPDHRLYQFTSRKAILENLKNCRLILDTTGIWKDTDFSSKGIEYHLTGDKSWL